MLALLLNLSSPVPPFGSLNLTLVNAAGWSVLPDANASLLTEWPPPFDVSAPAELQLSPPLGLGLVVLVGGPGEPTQLQLVPTNASDSGSTGALHGAVAVLLQGVELPSTPGTASLDMTTLHPNGQLMDLLDVPVPLAAYGLQDVSFVPSASRAGQLVSLTVAFTTRLEVPTDAQLLICLPADFGLASISLSNLTFAGGVDLYAASSVAGAAGCFRVSPLPTALGLLASPAGAHSVSVSGLVLGPMPGMVCELSVRLQQTFPEVLDRERFLVGACLELTPNVILASSVAMAQPHSRSDSDLELTFTLTNPWPADGWLALKLPPRDAQGGADFHCGGEPLAARSLDLDALNGSLAMKQDCAASVHPSPQPGERPELFIQRVGAGEPTTPGSTLRLAVRGLLAPLYEQNVSGLSVLTRASGGVSGTLGVVIDEASSDFPPFALAPGPLVVQNATFSTLDAGRNSELRLKVYLPSELPPGAQIWVHLPEAFEATLPVLLEAEKDSWMPAAAPDYPDFTMTQTSLSDMFFVVAGGASIPAKSTYRWVVRNLHNPKRRMVSTDLVIRTQMPFGPNGPYAEILSTLSPLVPPQPSFEVLGFHFVGAALLEPRACAVTTLLVAFNSSRQLHKYTLIDLVLPPSFTLDVDCDVGSCSDWTMQSFAADAVPQEYAEALGGVLPAGALGGLTRLDGPPPALSHDFVQCEGSIVNAYDTASTILGQNCRCVSCRR